MIALTAIALYYTAIGASALTSLAGAITTIIFWHPGEDRTTNATITLLFAATALLLWAMRHPLTNTLY